MAFESISVARGIDFSYREPVASDEALEKSGVQLPLAAWWPEVTPRALEATSKSSGDGKELTEVARRAREAMQKRQVETPTSRASGGRPSLMLFWNVRREARRAEGRPGRASLPERWKWHEMA